MKKFFEKYANVIIVLGLMIITLIYSRLVIPRPGLWFDEMYSVWIASHTFPNELFQCIWADDVHAPLYHIFLHFYMQIFGAKVPAIQFSSTIFSLILIPVVYKFGKEIFSKKVGLWAATFLTFNALFIYGTSFVRFYVPASIFLTLSTFYIFKLMKDSSWKNIIGVAIFNTLLMYTLTTGSIYVFLQGLLFGIYFLIKRKDLAKPFLMASGIAFLLYAPYLPVFIHQYLNIKNSILGSYSSLFGMRWFDFINVFTTLIHKTRIGTIILPFFKCLICAVGIIFIFKSITLKKIEEKLLFWFFVVIFGFHTMLSIANLAPFNTTYAIAFLGIFVLAFANAFENIKLTTLKVCILAMMIIPQLNFYSKQGYTLSEELVMTYRFGGLINTMSDLKLNEDDLIFSPNSSKLIRAFGIKAKSFDICHNAGYLIYNDQRMIDLFGEESLNLKTSAQKAAFIYNYINYRGIYPATRNFYEKMMSDTKIGSKIVVDLPGHKQTSIYNKVQLKNTQDMIELINTDSRLEVLKETTVPYTQDLIVVFERIK
ncbi:glycosyltransferase family 39 protein [bacterium]|nr:glycosyltransferase family 39 protein [bacterium]